MNLKREIDKVPLWQDNHVSSESLAEYFARYLYLPKLKSEQVLIRALTDSGGGLFDGFVLAQGYDAATGRYLGLGRTSPDMVRISRDILVVEQTVANMQMAEERLIASTGGGTPTQQAADGVKLTLFEPISGPNTAHPAEHATTQPKTITRFHGTVILDPLRISRDASQIASEVVQHLTSIVSSRTHITMEIEIEVSSGIPENTVRIIAENCQTLKIKSDFE